MWSVQIRRLYWDLRDIFLGKQLGAAALGPHKLFEYSVCAFHAVPNEETHSIPVPLTERKRNQIEN